MKRDNNEKLLVVNNRARSTQSIFRKVLQFWDVIDVCDMCDEIDDKNYLGIILSGTDAPVQNPILYQKERELIQKASVPILGICGGLQLIAITFGAKLIKLLRPSFGRQEVSIASDNPLFKGMESQQLFLKKHIYSVSDLPDIFHVIAFSQIGIEAIQHHQRPLFGVQFHPEYRKSGEGVLKNFVSICIEARRNAMQRRLMQ